MVDKKEGVTIYDWVHVCVGEGRRKVDARPRTWISVEPVVTNTLLQQCVGFRFDSVLPELHHAHFEITTMYDM